MSDFLSNVAGTAVTYLIVFIILGTPVFLTMAEVVFLFRTMKKPETITGKKRTFWFIVDLAGIVLANIYIPIYLSLCDVVIEAGWDQQLHNSERHQPIFTGSLPTIITLCVLAVIGYCVLNLINVNKLPPLVPVLSMSALYLGVLVSIVFTFHVTNHSYVDVFLLLPPVNYILMGIRSIYRIIRDYEPSPELMEKEEVSNVPAKIAALLSDAKKWPIIALVLMLPLLGILICILILFGQAPDAAIKAFTETADFRLSQKIPPQNLYVDEHYLCTVAAGGDKKVVKPLRMGIRHGHPVVVNRQLCIANAFEQILEERTPRFHRIVRSFYDKYGFPVAKLIKTKLMADIVYFIMKPLEWIFLAVLYLTDVNPENRIAMQYTGRKYRAC